jgi:hypothetical protein
MLYDEEAVVATRAESTSGGMGHRASYSNEKNRLKTDLPGTILPRFPSTQVPCIGYNFDC